MEDGLEEGNIDEGELDEERGRDGEEEHFVDVALEEGYVESSVLECGSEIEEDERCEGLKDRVESELTAFEERNEENAHHRLIPG